MFLSKDLEKQLSELAKYPYEIGGVIEGDTIKILFVGNHVNVDLDWTGETDILFHTHPHNNDPPSAQDVVYLLASVTGDLAHIVHDSKQGIYHGKDTYLSVKRYIVASRDAIYIYYPSEELINNILELLENVYDNNFTESLSELLDEIGEKYGNSEYTLDEIRSVGISIIEKKI